MKNNILVEPIEPIKPFEVVLPPLHYLPKSDSMQHWLVRHAKSVRKAEPARISGCLVAKMIIAVDLEDNIGIFTLLSENRELVPYYEAYTGEKAVFE